MDSFDSLPRFAIIVNMDLYSVLITFVILIFSAIVHEVSHGLMAERLGDNTARDEGRITLNPIPHIDLFYSILLPLALLLAGSPIVFGAAKPVPVDFQNLRPRKLGMALVSLAGPLSNFILAVLFGVIIKIGLANSLAMPILLDAILINLILGTFNLIPIPPLDGSKIVASLLPEDAVYGFFRFERWGFILVYIFLLLGVLDYVLMPVLNLYSRIFGLQLL